MELPERLPVVALRDLVFFPYMVLPLLIGRPRSTVALREAEAAPDRLLLLLAQRDPEKEDAGEEDVFRVGTVARVVQVTPLPDTTCRGWCAASPPRTVRCARRSPPSRPRPSGTRPAPSWKR